MKILIDTDKITDLLINLLLNIGEKQEDDYDNIPILNTVEVGKYHGRHNGDRPTWYFDRALKDYPSEFYLGIVGCTSFVVLHNDVRWEKDGYIVKQSDVSGRGMTIVAPAFCKSKIATITY